MWSVGNRTHEQILESYSAMCFVNFLEVFFFFVLQNFMVCTYKQFSLKLKGGRRQ